MKVASTVRRGAVGKGPGFRPGTSLAAYPTFKVRTVFASVAVSKNWLDVVFVLGRCLKHRRIKKAQEEYPGIVHFLRIEKAEDLDADLVGWLQEAFDYRKQKDAIK